MHRAHAVLLLGAVLGAVAGGGTSRDARAGGDDPLAALSGTQVLEIAKALSTDAMRGRKTGFEGGKKADDYVAQAMAEMGLDPKDPAGAYLDPFEFQATQVKAPIACSLAGAPLAYGTDFVDLLYSGEGKVEGEVVFVGYGICAPAKGYDEYAGLDVKGKIVLAIRGAPASRTADFPEERFIGAKCALAKEHGAKAFLLCEGDLPVVGTIQPAWFRPDMPGLSLSRAVTDKILAASKTTLDAERKARDAAKEAGKAIATGTRVALEVHMDHLPRARGHNALGAIPGRDPDLRGEVVLVGAHMDHLGVDALGRVYNGADDNASGTAVLLHVARTLLEAGWKPKRTILFVAFGGEEQGLVGSKHLAEGLPFEHDALVCVLNMDMVGQGKPSVRVAGADRFPAMGARLAGYVPEALQKTVALGGGLDPNGDHWPFAEKGVPAFFLSTEGEHPNYHAVGDDVENLVPGCLEAAAKVLGTLVLRLGDEPQRLREAGPK